MIERTEHGLWKLPEGFTFISSRTQIVSHIRRGAEYNALCGAAPNYTIAQPSNTSMSKICPKCKKEYRELIHETQSRDLHAC